MLSLLELCVHYSNWILSSSYQYDSITQTLASCNVTQDGNYAYIFLKFFFYEFWLNYTMAAHKSLALALGVMPNTVSLRKTTQKHKTKLLIYGSPGLVWIHGHPESLALFWAMWPWFSSLLISPISALGLVPPLFHANCSLYPAGPHATAGSSSSRFSCQIKSSVSNITGPIFLSALRTGSHSYR